MAGQSKTTTDHEEIRKWAEEREGHPATVSRTGDEHEPGVLRIDFPGYSGAGSLEEISWDEFFQKFDEKNLAFLYQDETRDGEQSRFFKLVSRHTADEVEHRADHAKKDEHKAAPKAEHDKEHEHKAAPKAQHDKKDEHKPEHKAAPKAEHKDEHKPEHKPEHKAAPKTEHDKKDEHKSEHKEHAHK